MNLSSALSMLLFPFADFNLHFVSAKNMSSGASASMYLLGKRNNDPTDYYIKESAGTVYDPSGLLKQFGIKHGSEIQSEHFESLCAALHPITGKPLLKQHGDQHRAGTDFAFAPPKCFSALWAVAPPEVRAMLERINKLAVQKGLDHLNEYSVTRIGAQGKQKVSAPFAAISFQHGSNRDGEPQLHLHNAILNLTEVNGKWRSLEPRPLFQNQTSADALYQAEVIALLQAEFQGLEVKHSDNKHSFEIEGIPEELVKHWSGRRQEMISKAKEEGVSIDDAGGMDRINYIMRKAKGEMLENPHLAWAAEAKEFGFSTSEAEALLSRPAVVREPVTDSEIQLKVTEAIDALLQTTSVISDNHINRAVAEAFFGRLDSSAIKAVVSDLQSGKLKLLQEDRVVRLGDIDGMAQFSTASMIATERRLHEISGKLSKDGQHAIKKSVIESAIDDMGFLSDEQKHLVRHLCADGSLKIGEGSAGSGKSTSTLAAANAFKASGYTVQGLSSSWSASKILEHDAQISSRAIAGFLNDVANGKQKLDDKTVLMVDEAGLNGSQDAERLVSAAEKSGAKIVFLGEESQLSPVSAGPAMGIMIESAGAQTLATIRRQREPEEREMVANFRDGKSDLALDHLDKNGRLSFHRNADTAKKQLIRDWKDYTYANPGKSTLILAVKNSDVRSLNEQVREILKERGQLTGQEVTLKTPGANASTVSTKFSVGDQIMLKKTDKELDVTNNTRAEILDIKETSAGGYVISAKLESGREINIDTLRFKDQETGGVAIKHGYASTSWSAQGATVDRGFVFAEGMDRRYGYVAMSRHRDEVNLYVNEGGLRSKLISDKRLVTKASIMGELATQLHRKSVKLSTLDFQDDRYSKLQAKAKSEREELMSRLTKPSTEIDDALKAMEAKIQLARAEAEARRAAEESIKNESVLRMK